MKKLLIMSAAILLNMNIFAAEYEPYEAIAENKKTIKWNTISDQVQSLNKILSQLTGFKPESIYLALESLGFHLIDPEEVFQKAKSQKLQNVMDFLINANIVDKNGHALNDDGFTWACMNGMP